MCLLFLLPHSRRGQVFMNLFFLVGGGGGLNFPKVWNALTHAIIFHISLNFHLKNLVSSRKSEKQHNILISLCWGLIIMSIL